MARTVCLSFQRVKGAFVAVDEEHGYRIELPEHELARLVADGAALLHLAEIVRHTENMRGLGQFTNES